MNVYRKILHLKMQSFYCVNDSDSGKEVALQRSQQVEYTVLDEW
jgi:hypothetical protein